jgi:predicted dehydrogenase
MIRIGLVGSASSHAPTFARLLNVDQVAGDRARVVGIWSGFDPTRTQAVAQEGDIPEIAGSLHQLVDRVEAAIIVDRHGDLHAEHALPFLLEGKPVFVDKPLAIDLADCRRMLNAARHTGTAITSLSALGVAPDTEAMRAQALGAVRLGQFAGPCDFASPHGGPFFYATHLIELARSLLGEGVVGLQSTRAGDTIVVDAIWESDAVGSLGFVRDAACHFHTSLFGTEGMASREIRVDDDAYSAVLRVAIEMFETRRDPLDSRRLLLPIVVTHAIMESLARDGGWVDVAAMLDRELEALG